MGKHASINPRRGVGKYAPRHSSRRQCPPDFAKVYLDIGWDGIEDHFGAHWEQIRRWIEECGGEKLRRARMRVVKLRKARGMTRGHNLGGTDDLPAQALAELELPEPGLPFEGNAS